MKALILGGSRFIGRRLAREMAEAGHRVTLFNRGNADDGLGHAVERLRGDRRIPGALAAALGARSFDVACDFISFDAADARGAVEALQGRVAHFIHVSTCSVYWCTGEFPCPVAEEAFDRHGEFDERPGSIEYSYGYNKRKAEEVLGAAWRKRRFPATILRMPVVGGEGDLSLRHASYALRLLDGGPIVLPDSGLAPFRQVWVADVTSLISSIADRPEIAGQAFNLAGEEILTVRRLVDLLGAILGHRPELIPIPSELLVDLDRGRSFSPFSQPAAQVPAIERARRLLAWNPRRLEEWLEGAVKWGIEHCRRGQVSPAPLAFRADELQAAAWFRTATLRRDAPGGTSASRPG